MCGAVPRLGEAAVGGEGLCHEELEGLGLQGKGAVIPEWPGQAPMLRQIIVAAAGPVYTVESKRTPAHWQDENNGCKQLRNTRTLPQRTMNTLIFQHSERPPREQQ